jgi:tetratricopeptide (TPR) repeat protein
MTQAVDRLNLKEPDAAQEYRALVRALRRKQGFGLFFVQASPAKGQEILTDLRRRDLVGKRVAKVTIGRTDDLLFERLEELWEREKVDLFWIEGLEQSLLEYEDMQRLAGWDEQDLLTYSWKDVPPILSHLNLGRERFEARFNCALVFVVPLFVVKYLLRRAGDFFDWKSGFFEFPEDRLVLAKRVIESGNHKDYLKLNAVERLQKILQIKDLLDAPALRRESRVALLREMGALHNIGGNYEQAAICFTRAIQTKLDVASYSDSLMSLGKSMLILGRVAKTALIYGLWDSYVIAQPEPTKKTFLTQALYREWGDMYVSQGHYTRAIQAYQQELQLNPRYTNASNSLQFAYYGYDRMRSLSSQRVIQLILNDSHLIENLAYFQYKIGDHKSSLNSFKKLVEIEPENRDFSCMLAHLYLLRGDIEKAKNVLSKLVGSYLLR